MCDRAAHISESYFTDGLYMLMYLSLSIYIYIYTCIYNLCNALYVYVTTLEVVLSPPLCRTHIYIYGGRWQWGSTLDVGPPRSTSAPLNWSH